MMPRVVQPSGGGGKMRVRYTARRKRGLVATAKRMQADGISLRAAAEELRVSVTNLSRWVLQGMGEIDHLATATATAMANDDGAEGAL